MDERIGDVFLERTKYQYLGPSDQQKKLPQPPLFCRLREGIDVELPSPAGRDPVSGDLQRLIEGRRSLRAYADVPLSLDGLSYLLWCTQGVKPESTEQYTLRTVPSAGARHPFETLVLANRVDELDAGLYQYDAAAHRLIRWDVSQDIADQLAEACLGQQMLVHCAVALIWVADRYRMAWRYGERGIRYLHLDAGHVCQNAYLAAASLGAGACAVGAFDDDRINGLLGLDGVEQFVVYLATIGMRDS